VFGQDGAVICGCQDGDVICGCRLITVLILFFKSQALLHGVLCDSCFNEEPPDLIIHLIM
jgi:hypothetical protein